MFSNTLSRFEIFSRKNINSYVTKLNVVFNSGSCPSNRCVHAKTNAADNSGTLPVHSTSSQRNISL